MVVFFFAMRRKSSKAIKYVDTIRYHHAKSDTVFQCRTLSWKVRHCQTRGSSNSFHSFSLYHIVSCAGKRYLTVTYESVLIVTILHHIVFACDILSNITESLGGKANFYVASESIKQAELTQFSKYSNFVHRTITV